MRNLRDEQAVELAFDIVRDHLLAGVEYIDVVEAVDESFEEEDPTDEDYSVVNKQVDRLMNLLIEELIDLN